MDVSANFSRRALLIGGAALAVVGCGGGEPQTADKAAAPAPKAAGQRDDLAWAVAGGWREADRPRDAWRHPVETLRFFGIQPGMTVVEMWPGSGWYTRILGPYLRATNGRLYAAQFETAEGERSAPATIVEGYRAMVSGRRDIYGDVQFVTFGRTSPPLTSPGAADMVLFMQNVHSWMAAGLAEKAFEDAFTALKPGGVLGVEAHRAPMGEGPQDPLAADGYVQEAYVRELAEEAGFRFDKAAEINANPKDTRDHPFGVWTLPPEGRTAPAGAPPDPNFDRAPFDAIGESDRMTLRFVKPV